MEFSKVSEQKAWDNVHTLTDTVRNGGFEAPALIDWFRQRGIAVRQSVFPVISAFDDGVYTGTLVDQHRHVLEFFVDLTAPDDAELNDVSSELGPKDPSHPECDRRNPIAMGLLYYDLHRAHAA